ncbi:MAG: hypothetical protein PHH21_03910, partial [Candidatus Pacebacteria bacterium]|nr:hypothetical protein [Candidatus Paceibacterota bacterium]
MQNSRHIACGDNVQKYQAFPLRGTGCIAFIDGKRPGTAETDHHNNFKNIHNNFLISYPDGFLLFSFPFRDINNFIHTPG